MPSVLSKPYRIDSYTNYQEDRISHQLDWLAEFLDRHKQNNTKHHRDMIIRIVERIERIIATKVEVEYYATKRTIVTRLRQAALDTDNSNDWSVGTRANARRLREFVRMRR